MRLWNQCVLGTVLGKAPTAFDDIGTITIRRGSNHLVGIYVCIVNAKPTADEATTPRLRINSTDLGWSNFDLPGFSIGGEGMAAHQASLVQKIFIPLKAPNDKEGEDLWFADITFSVSGVVACTEGFECGIQLITSDVEPSEALMNALKGDWCGDFTGGNGAVEAAGAGNDVALAPWGTDDASMIVVDSVANNMVGICYTLGANAETVNVGIVNYAELTCPDIPEFTPQQHLCNHGISGALGTVIDSFREMPARMLAFAFDDLPSVKVRIAIADITSITGFTAADGQLNLVWN